MVNSMGYLIGIDAGGTKTAAAAYDCDSGKCLASASSGPGNFSVDSDSTLQNLSAAVDQCIEKCGKPCDFLCVGAAGVRENVQRRQLTDQLSKRYRCKVRIIDDGELALYAALKGEDGLLVISGTGSIAYAKRGELVRRYGGWGHLLDDRGSGYDIAIRVFRQMVQDYDDEKEMSPLSVAVLRFLKLDTVQQAITFLYRVQKGEIASIVPVVEKLANEGDPQAMNLLIHAGEELAGLVITLAKKIHLHTIRIVPMGGVLLHCQPVLHTFFDSVKSHLPNAQFIISSNDPTLGGYYFYKTVETAKRSDKD